MNRLKIIGGFLGAFFFLGEVLAVAPGEINYQGKLSNASGNPLTGTYNIRFRICNALSGGSCAYYDQTASNVSVTNGVFNVGVGRAPMSAIPSSVFQGGADRWLLISVGGIDLSPRQKLGASAYALSLQAGSITDTEISSSAEINPNKIDGGSFQNENYSFPLNLGLGVTNPSSRLTVRDGDIRISTTTGSRGIIFQDGTVQTTTVGPVGPGEITNVEISNSAEVNPNKIDGGSFQNENYSFPLNLGLGVTNPSSRLTVQNGDIRISTTTGSRGIIFQDGTVQATAESSAGPGSITNTEISNSADISANKINGGSFQSENYSFPLNLGVGITNPPSKFTVRDGDIRILTTGGSYGIIFQDGTVQTTAAGSVAPGSITNTEISNSAEISPSKINGGNFQSGDNYTFQQDLRVNRALNLSGGTASSGGRIDLGSGANDDLTTTDVTDLTDGGASTLHSHAFPSETDPQVGTISTSRVPRWNGSALVTGTIYDNGTNVGIGTTSPSQKLQVNGNIRVNDIYLESLGDWLSNLIN